MVETDNYNSAYSELVSLTEDLETFQDWIEEEIESIISDWDIVNPEWHFVCYGYGNYTGKFRGAALSITIDIQKKEL